MGLPVPWWSRADGGRYIGTWHLNITNDPDTGKRNVGVYRMSIIDGNHTTISVSRNSHLQKHFSIAENRGEALPMSVAIGVSDPFVMAAASALPVGVDEFTVAGALMQEPVRLVEGLTIPVESPADAEIVLEGRIVPGARTPDGPFFDYCGIPTTNPRAFIFEVSAIRMRENPVFRGAAIGIPGAEDLMLYSLLANLELYNFHGSRVRHAVQGFLFRNGWHRLVQLSGR
jgi:4-hydroxy-3-polyprenylbenzoate decarboxylase